MAMIKTMTTMSKLCVHSYLLISLFAAFSVDRTNIIMLETSTPTTTTATDTSTISSFFVSAEASHDEKTTTESKIIATKARMNRLRRSPLFDVQKGVGYEGENMTNDDIDPDVTATAITDTTTTSNNTKIITIMITNRCCYVVRVNRSYVRQYMRPVSSPYMVMIIMLAVENMMMLMMMMMNTTF